MSEVAASGPDHARQVARDAVRRRLTALHWSQREAAKRADVTPNTLGDYLNGSTQFPDRMTLSKIESALSWPVGTIPRIWEGHLDEEDITRLVESPLVATELPRAVVHFPSSALEGLSESEIAEAEAFAIATGLARLREIKEAKARQA